jgi:hypothetical protein
VGRGHLNQRTGTRVDRWHHHTDRQVDPLELNRHPATVSAAHALGYAVEGLDLQVLEDRYRGAPDPGLDRWSPAEIRPRA